MPRILLCLPLLLSITSTGIAAPIGKAPKPIDAETVAAFEKIGGYLGRYERPPTSIHLTFIPCDLADLKGQIPLFKFTKEPKEALPKTESSFGLYFEGNEFSEEWLKNLKDVPHLAAVHMTMGNLKLDGKTLASLKDLKELTIYLRFGANLRTSLQTGKRVQIAQQTR